MADLWVQSFEGDPDDAVRDLQAAFGLDEQTARGIVDNAPCVVKRNVGPVEAMPWVRALREMGARVELRDEAVRQDPRASLRMPRARFGRKSLRPSDKGSKRPDAPAVGATIPNPLGGESEPEEAPGSDVLDEVMGEVLAEVAQPKPVPPRPVASEAGAPAAPKGQGPRESVPPPFLASALVTPTSSPAPRPSRPGGPAVFGPPPGATPSRASTAPEHPSVPEPPPASAAPGQPLLPLEEEDDDGDLRLDLSGDLDLGPEEPPAPLPPLDPPPSLEPAPNAAQDGYGFGEDPLEPPIPEGMLELDVVEPPPAPRPERPPSPVAEGHAGHSSGGHPAVVGDAPDELEDEAATAAAGRRAHLIRGAGMVGAGAVALAIAAAVGISSLNGGVALPWLIVDALALSGLGLGGAVIVGALRDRFVELGPSQIVGALVLSFALAAGFNFLNAPSPDEARRREVEQRDEAIEEGIAAGRYAEARAWAQSSGASPEVTRLIDALYTSGASQVYAGGAGDLIVVMPELQAARASIERAYRRFLGYRVDQVDASPHPATRYWRIIVVFAD